MVFSSGWFLTLFSSELPLEAVFRVFDMILFEGSNFVFNIALALLKKSVSELTKLSFEETMEYLKISLYELKFSNIGSSLNPLFLLR